MKVKHMGKSPEVGPESSPEVSIEADEVSSLPFDFSGAAVVVMKDYPEMGRAMWRALLDGEAGETNRVDAMVRLRELFWDMIDGYFLENGIMVEELIKEQDPDYKEHMGLPDREGPELARVLGIYDLLSSSERPRGR